VPRKKGTLAKVTAMATGVSETVKNVNEIVEEITGTVSEVVQAIKQKEDTPPRKKAWMPEACSFLSSIPSLTS
jgi:glycine cleavage system H lipoate-binding protein